MELLGIQVVHQARIRKLGNIRGSRRSYWSFRRACTWGLVLGVGHSPQQVPRDVPINFQVFVISKTCRQSDEYFLGNLK